MSAAEIASRTGDVAYRIVERHQLRKPPPSAIERLRAALPRKVTRVPDWCQRVLSARASRASFLPGFREQPAIRQHFERQWPQQLAEARRRADAAARHEFEFFGQTFACGPRVNWHADPVSGRRWPFRYHGDVPTSGHAECGDVKYVWELSRHQFLIDLGKAAFLFDEARYREALLDLVTSWIADNPYGMGVNWASPLEPAFRVLSWLPAYYCCLETASLTPDAHVTWLAGFHDHGRFLHRHLEYYSSPFNHLIGEAAALYMLGLLFPEFSEAAAWRRRGRRVLESRVDRQFYPDGGACEQATFYHHATLAFYVLAALTARANGEELGAPVWHAMERAIDFSMYLQQPDGRTPSIGDADDGKPIRFEHRLLWDFRAFQSIGAVLFDRPDFKYAAGGFHEDALWLLGTDGRDRYDRLECVPPAETSRVFSRSGYFILRSGWSRTADYVCFDCGEQGLGARHDNVPDALHGHADCLAVVAWLGGEPLFVDAGFLCYNGPDDWQDYFRKTAAHNTATIDGRDQSRHLGKMAWSDTPRYVQEDWTVDAHGSRATGSHDGYGRGPQGVVHRRTVWLRPAGYIVIYDEFLGEGAHSLSLNFQMPPGVDARVDAGAIHVSERLHVAWVAGFPLQPTLSEGGPAPSQGWVAPSLGVRRPAPRLTLVGSFSGPAAGVLTICADLERVARVSHLGAVRDSAGRCLAMTVETTAGEDLVVAVEGPAFRGAALHSDARVVICSEEDRATPVVCGTGYTSLWTEPAALNVLLRGR